MSRAERDMVLWSTLGAVFAIGDEARHGTYREPDSWSSDVTEKFVEMIYSARSREQLAEAALKLRQFLVNMALTYEQLLAFEKDLQTQED